MSLRRYAYCVLLMVGFNGPAAQLAHAQEGGTTAQEPEDPVERARLHFKLGVDFYRELNYRAALIEFERAYKASPHYKLLYNLGQVSIDLQEDWKAIDYFTRYLREGGSELPEPRRIEVEQSISRLEKRLAQVTVTVNLAGAEIYVDDSRVGHSPLAEPIKISVGRRRFVAVKQGYPDAERVVDVASGDDVEVELEFKERPVVAQVQTIKVTEK
jgi:tetratricopeptide (TPR) repeat protein